MQSELRSIQNIEGVAREGVRERLRLRLRIVMPNNGNLLAENLIFMPPPTFLPSSLRGPCASSTCKYKQIQRDSIGFRSACNAHAAAKT